jgi:glycine oxidase
MLSVLDPHTPPAHYDQAHYSGNLYPEFIKLIEGLSDQPAGHSDTGALYVSAQLILGWQQYKLPHNAIQEVEPCLAATDQEVYLLPEGAVDPRTLLPALLSACRKSGVTVHHQHEVLHLLVENGSTTGVRSKQGDFFAPRVVNCAGAWAATLPEGGLLSPTFPVKGQMLAVLPPTKPGIVHTIRSHEIYMVPRLDGRIVIGATVETVGFNKQVEPQTIQRLHQLAADLVPSLGEARMMEAWAGLRPGSPDELPILGPAGNMSGYFVATGHFRNGILLAPATAKLMSALIAENESSDLLTPFSPARFA